LPFLTNPATLAVVGIGLIGYKLSQSLSEKAKGDDSQTVPSGSEPLYEPYGLSGSDGWEDAQETVQGTVAPYVRQLECHTEDDWEQAAVQNAEAPDPDDLKKEIIRQAMSELGKRSGAARRRKKEMR
jgi:hypothetical protein